MSSEERSSWQPADRWSFQPRSATGRKIHNQHASTAGGEGGPPTTPVVLTKRDEEPAVEEIDDYSLKSVEDYLSDECRRSEDDVTEPEGIHANVQVQRNFAVPNLRELSQTRQTLQVGTCYVFWGFGEFTFVLSANQAVMLELLPRVGDSYPVLIDVLTILAGAHTSVPEPRFMLRYQATKASRSG